MKKARITTLQLGAEVQFQNGEKGTVVKKLPHCIQVKTEDGYAAGLFKSKRSDITSFHRGKMFVLNQGTGDVEELQETIEKEELFEKEKIVKNIKQLKVEIEIRMYEEGWSLLGNPENSFSRFKDLRAHYGLKNVRRVGKRGANGIYKAEVTQNF